jgi:hypothetical protein
MSMLRRTLALSIVLLISSLSFSPVTAQGSPLPGIEITCVNEENPLFLEVNSGSAQAVASCTIENPSSYAEEIEIEYDGDGLSVAGPESLSLAAGDEQTIQISAQSSSLESIVYNMTVSVQVVSVQEIEVGEFLQMFLGSDETNILALVPDFVDLRVTSQPASMVLSSELMQPMSASVMITNDGNVEDDLTVTIQNSAVLDQRNIGWNITNSGQGDAIDSNGGSATYTLRFTPNSNMDDESLSITIRIKSGFDNSESVDVTLIINTTAPEENILDLTAMNIPTWAYIAAATLGTLFLFAILRSVTKRANRASQAHLGELDDGYDEDEDEDEDVFEEDFELEDLDDELDDLDDELDDLDNFEF